MRARPARRSSRDNDPGAPTVPALKAKLVWTTIVVGGRVRDLLGGLRLPAGDARRSRHAVGIAGLAARAADMGSDPMSWEFLITSFIVVASPGTGVLYTLAAGLSRGSRASIVAAFGCTLGIVPHMAAAITGARGAAAHQRARVPDLQISRRRVSALHGLGHAAGARRAEHPAGDRRAHRTCR